MRVIDDETMDVGELVDFLLSRYTRDTPVVLFNSLEDIYFELTPTSFTVETVYTTDNAPVDQLVILAG
jgi:hypothetical protein